MMEGKGQGRVGDVGSEEKAARVRAQWLSDASQPHKEKETTKRFSVLTTSNDCLNTTCTSVCSYWLQKPRHLLNQVTIAD